MRGASFPSLSSQACSVWSTFVSAAKLVLELSLLLFMLLLTLAVKLVHMAAYGTSLLLHPCTFLAVYSLSQSVLAAGRSMGVHPALQTPKRSIETSGSQSASIVGNTKKLYALAINANSMHWLGVFLIVAGLMTAGSFAQGRRHATADPSTQSPP